MPEPCLRRRRFTRRCIISLSCLFAVLSLCVRVRVDARERGFRHGQAGLYMKLADTLFFQQKFEKKPFVIRSDGPPLPFIRSLAAKEEEDGLLRLLSRAITNSFRWLRLSPESIPPQAESRIRAACCFWPEDDLQFLTDRVRCSERHAEWLPSIIANVGMNTDITPLLVQCAAMRMGIVIEPIVPPVLALWAADLEGGWGPLAWCIHPGFPLLHVMIYVCICIACICEREREREGKREASWLSSLRP